MVFRCINQHPLSIVLGFCPFTRSHSVTCSSETTTPPSRNTAVMAPKLKAKGDALKLIINENKPAITMIEDGPIVDSPVAIDLGGWHPEKGPQDVGVFFLHLR